jgi:hypothetical protein
MYVCVFVSVFAVEGGHDIMLAVEMEGRPMLPESCGVCVCVYVLWRERCRCCLRGKVCVYGCMYISKRRLMLPESVDMWICIYCIHAYMHVPRESC